MTEQVDRVSARFRAAALGATLASLVGAPADAAPRLFASGASPVVRLQIAAKPVRAALIEFALQAELSLGGDLEMCGGQAPALTGRLTVAAALDRILAGSGCDYRQPDPRTVIIRRANAAPARPVRQAPAQAPTGLGEVVITAQRYPNLPGRTPYAISVISADRLERQALTSLHDLAGQVAGMTVTNLGPGRDKVLLRGLSDGAFTGQAQSMVSLYLDEVPITYSAPDPNLRLTDIERVEIMRGPQGTLYGGGALGGVMRIATRKPDLDRYSASVLTGASFTQGGGSSSELEVVANLPLIRGRAALRALVYREAQDGYIANSSLGLSRVNSSDQVGMRASLRAMVTPNWTATLGVTHQSNDNQDTQYGLRRLGPKIRDSLVREPHDSDFDHASLTLAGNGGWGRVTGAISRLSHRFGSRYDATAASLRYDLAGAPAAFDEDKAINLTVVEITYATPSEYRLHGLVGAFASDGSIGLDSSLHALPARSPAVYAERRRDGINEEAIYGEVTFDATARLSATAGLRWFNYSFDTDSTVTQTAGERQISRSAEATGFSPKLLLAYDVRPGVLFYAQAAEGYRPGGFNTAGRIGQMFDAPNAPPRRYVADELWNYELGAKFRAFDDRLQGRAAAFYATWESIQSDQYLADGTAYTVNIGDGANRGFEVEAAFRASERLDLRAAALLNDPEVTRFNAAFSPRAGAALPGVSRVSASLGVDYHRDLASGPTLRLQGQASYVGTSYLTFDADHLHEMGDLVTLRGVASLTTPGWTLSATLDNPLNSHANSFSFGNPYLIGREQIITPPRPRTLSLRFSKQF
ncbi:TonB-dependent receptor [Caulobacter segnis]|uniref:TonB-dependent receptor n=1 Tax=Caulobacter segnis TaxID=88688 RepID=UPI0028584D76|nr:TonB-dependent receptor [Caulobacter segnis]MDR6625010.1 outer membrane receptor protein involved in Fe transport [Caulobacter segnis]